MKMLRNEKRITMVDFIKVYDMWICLGQNFVWGLFIANPILERLV